MRWAIVGVVAIAVVGSIAACRNPFGCIGSGDECAADHGSWHADEGTCGRCEYPPVARSSPTSTPAPTPPPTSTPTPDDDADVDAGVDAGTEEDAADAADD